MASVIVWHGIPCDSLENLPDLPDCWLIRSGGDVVGYGLTLGRFIESTSLLEILAWFDENRDRVGVVNKGLPKAQTYVTPDVEGEDG